MTAGARRVGGVLLLLLAVAVGPEAGPAERAPHGRVIAYRVRAVVVVVAVPHCGRRLTLHLTPSPGVVDRAGAPQPAPAAVHLDPEQCAKQVQQSLAGLRANNAYGAELVASILGHAGLRHVVVRPARHPDGSTRLVGVVFGGWMDSECIFGEHTPARTVAGFDRGASDGSCVRD